MDIIYERPPLPYPAALRALARCSASTARLLRQHRLRLPVQRVGTRLHFADGTAARVYRETVAGRGATEDPCVLVVEFRLRAVRGRAHAAFRWESLLNTPLFAGFPGFVSKLWLAHDERGRYRGLYEWDGSQRADHYAVPCGGCSRWCRCQDRFTTRCCQGCAVTTSSRDHMSWPGRRQAG